MRFPFLKQLKQQCYLTGFDTKIPPKTVRSVPFFLKSIAQYGRMNPRPTFRITLNDLFPILSDRRKLPELSAATTSIKICGRRRKIRDRMPHNTLTSARASMDSLPICLSLCRSRLWTFVR